MKFPRCIPWFAWLLSFGTLVSVSAATNDYFDRGVACCRAGQFPEAAAAFQSAASNRPAAGTLVNLGLAEWQRGHAGAAIVAWEQARWIDPRDAQANANLQFAREVAQVDAPLLKWHETVSTWLPPNWWTWIAGASLWLAVGFVMLPGILRWRKATWHQAVAALCLMVFLLSVPAYAGLHTRLRLGFVLQPDTPLRMTPTLEAQALTRLQPGEPARAVRTRANYVLIRTNRTQGWVEKAQFGLISQ